MSPAWSGAKMALEGANYFVDDAGYVFRVVWLNTMTSPQVTVVWSPLSRKEINVAEDADTAGQIALKLVAVGSKGFPSGLDNTEAGKNEAIAFAKTVAGGSKKSGGDKKSTPDTSLVASGGGRMTTSGGRRGGSTPFYKNPWVIGGATVAVLGIVLAFALGGKGKKS